MTPTAYFTLSAANAGVPAATIDNHAGPIPAGNDLD